MAAPVTVVTVCLTLSLTWGALSLPAVAEPGHHLGTRHSTVGQAFPTQEQVDAAKTAARRRAADVGAIKARLLMAEQRLEDAATRAEQASEAYNGAMWRLEQAKQRWHRARHDAAEAQRTVASQRDRIGALVAQSYQDAGDLNAIHAMADADGPVGLLDQYSAFQGASSAMDADLQRFAAADSLAEVFARKARRAKADQARMAEQAGAAKQRAVAAAEAAQAEASSIATEKDRLIQQLAQAQHISVSLAQQRQAALEQLARERAEERARRQAIAEARAKAAAEAKARADAAARQRAAAAAKKKQNDPTDSGSGTAPGTGDNGGVAGDRAGHRAHHGTRHGTGRSGGVNPAPPPPADPPPSDPPPADLPPSDPPPSDPPLSGHRLSAHGGASQAISYAKAQLGEPYVWGAAGPSSWDCSGLTMRAWASAGVWLPHYSVAQYDAGTPISVTDLRPGDLVFWSSNGRPSGIHHVAMYIGGGEIIHAPRTGRPVEIDNMYYWIPPDFFVRV